MRNCKVSIGNHIIASALGKLPELGLNNLVLLPPNRLRIESTVTVSILGQDIVLHPTTVLRPRVSDGRMRLVADSITVGGVPIPPALVRTRIVTLIQEPEQEVNAAIQAITARTDLQLQKVSVAGDQLILDFSS